MIYVTITFLVLAIIVAAAVVAVVITAVQAFFKWLNKKDPPKATDEEDATIIGKPD